MKTLFLRALLLTNLLLSFFSSHTSQDIIGKVTKVADGDTLTLDANGKKHKIRLSEIDTPERDQPYGTVATSVLTELLLGKRVRVKVVKKSDRYGRVIGRIFLGDTDVSAYMVEQGHAMVYRQYLTDDALLGLEDHAKYNKIGLWELPEEERVPPWEWRQQQRK